MKGTASLLPWAGFAPLRKGRIHVFCPKCHRKLSNAQRGKYDPPKATLVRTWCQRCGNGGKESDEIFYDARGREIPWEEVERTVKKMIQGQQP